MRRKSSKNSSRSSRRAGSRGFTFVESLAAMAFVAIVLPVLVDALLTANRAGVMADRTRTAVMLANRKLEDTVILTDWREGEGSGDFSPEYPGYRYTISDDAWPEDAMRVLTVEVFFDVQGHEQSCRLSTLVEDVTQ